VVTITVVLLQAPLEVIMAVIMVVIMDIMDIMDITDITDIMVTTVAGNQLTRFCFIIISGGESGLLQGRFWVHR
jgi:hypothetical protein